MNKSNKKVSITDNLKFIIPSLLGIVLFMIPIKHNNEITIPIAILSKSLVNYLGESLIYIITGFLIASAIISSITSILKPKFILNNKFLASLFKVSPIWLIA